MRFILLLLTCVSLVASVCGQAGNAYNTNDLTRLNALASRWERYWNKHNMDSMATMLKPDVDFVNVAGIWLKGRPATVADHKQKHEGVIFKNSTWSTDSVAIKYVKPDLAIVHIGWGLKDDYDADGTPRKPRHGIFTWVVVKEKEEWLLLAGHNVNIREPVVTTK